ncbi:MAG: 50S ribosomal protein L4, partial [Candidatus Heimdallarchaeota archaeon]|nr:50S ribosomal protein L4 [Candidatus Heimdallarchaeota archaeon]
KQGRFPLAGKLTTASSIGPGRGISKVPRTHGKKTHHASRAAIVNSTRGGRLFAPPTTEKRIIEKINKKEHKIALRSAVSATANKDIVSKRGHKVEKVANFPVIIEDNFDELEKSKQVIEVLTNLGLDQEIDRTSKRKIRPGKGKYRGRKYRTKVGPLLVVGNESKVLQSGKNILGVEVCKVNELSVEKLAPGTDAGRITIWTESAIKLLEEW